MQSSKCVAGPLACAAAPLRLGARISQRNAVAVTGPAAARPLFQGSVRPLVARPAAPAAEPSGRPDGGSSGSGEPEVQYSTEFGYSRKDIILIGVGLISFGYALYYGLQATGMDAAMAGNWVQLSIVVGLSIGWVGSYLYRVANKKMTYVQQLEDYEEAVMRKRLEEMPEAQLEQVMADIEQEKAERKARKGQM